MSWQGFVLVFIKWTKAKMGNFPINNKFYTCAEVKVRAQFFCTKVIIIFDLCNRHLDLLTDAAGFHLFQNKENDKKLTHFTCVPGSLKFVGAPFMIRSRILLRSSGSFFRASHSSCPLGCSSLSLPTVILENWRRISESYFMKNFAFNLKWLLLNKNTNTLWV